MHHIVVQRAVKTPLTPSDYLLKRFAKAALFAKKKKIELTIRIVGNAEMKRLNSEYRHKKKTTNVLSFPFDMPDEPKENFILGDIIISASVVNQEAKEQGKTPRAHWAHMVIHGTLHLLGYDHEKDQDAIIMERKETSILKSLGFPNPYS